MATLLVFFRFVIDKVVYRSVAIVAIIKGPEKSCTHTYSRSACVCIAFPHTYNMKPAHLTAQPAIVYPSSFPAPTPPCCFV